MQLERTRQGEIVLDAPAGGYASSGSSEIIYQLQVWWKTHKQGRVFDCNMGFTLPDGSFYSPDCAYLTEEQLVGITSKQMERFLHLCPAFVIELVSRIDRRKAAEAKMQDWISNGAELAWLVDPYRRSVTVYDPGRKPRTLKSKIVRGSSPVARFEFNAADVWSCYTL